MRTRLGDRRPLPDRLGLLLTSCLLLAACCLIVGACALPPIVPRPTATGSPLDEPTLSPLAEMTPAATITPGVTLITFWQPYLLERPEGALVVRLVREFEAHTPDVRVRVVSHGGVLGVHDAILTQMQTGESLPDVAVAFPSSIADLAAWGVVAPLDALVNDPRLGLSGDDLTDLYPSFLDAGRAPASGGQLVSIPFVQNAVGLWVNDTLLEQAGWTAPPATWADFEQACLDVQAQTGKRCLPFVESVSLLDAWLYSRGGRPLSDDGRQAAFNSPAGVQSLALLRRMIDAGLAWRPAGEYGDYLAFAQGEAAFAFSSTGSNRLYTEAYDEAVRNGMEPFRWHQAMIPQADPAQPATVLYGTSFFVLSSDPAREAASWRLIRWLIGREQTARWSEELGALPVRSSALSIMTSTVAAYPFLPAQVSDILPYARPEPAVPAALEVREILYTAITSVTQAYADPQATLDWAAERANAILARP